MVLPAAIGMRLGKSFNVVIAISVCVGFLGMLSGLTSSFYLDTPPGATITLVFILSPIPTPFKKFYRFTLYKFFFKNSSIL